MDQLTAMRTFVRLVEAGSFTRAAETLQLPKATVSRLINNLEAHLRMRLLNRTTRRVSVTPDGAAYYERIARLLNELDEIESTMLQAHASPRGTIRVDTLTVIATQIIIPALPDFFARYPEIQVDIGVSDRPIDLIAENVDCVVRIGSLTDQSLIARRIGEMRLMASAAPSYLERHGHPAHPSALEDGHMIVNYFAAMLPRQRVWTFKRGEETVEVNPRGVLAVNEALAYITAGLTGIGIIQVPEIMIREHLASGALVRLLPDWQTETLPIHVVYPPNRHLSNKVRVFIDWVAGVVSSSVRAA